MPRATCHAGKKGGYSTGYAHDPEEQKKYTDRTGNETAME